MNVWFPELCWACEEVKNIPLQSDANVNADANANANTDADADDDDNTADDGGGNGGEHVIKKSIKGW